MSNTAEELFKKAEGTLEQKIRNPVILQTLAERGYVAETEEQAAHAIKVAEEISQGILSGKVQPIPACELEEDGKLSKHASAAALEDPMTFAPGARISPDDLELDVKQAAAVLSFVDVGSAE